MLKSTDTLTRTLSKWTMVSHCIYEECSENVMALQAIAFFVRCNAMEDVRDMHSILLGIIYPKQEGLVSYRGGIVVN